MARTFRRNDVDAFAALRADMDARKSARRERARQFDDMGLDGEVLAARPLHGRKARREAQAALGWIA